MWRVEYVGDIILILFECNAIYVENVKDRSDTPKGCNMLCMSKMLKMGKEHTHTFLLITFLIFNRFSMCKKFWKLRLRAFQPYHQILCILKHVEDVKDRSNTPKDCNAMYVEDVEDGKGTCTHIFAHNFLNIQLIFNPQKVLESWDLGLSNHTKSYVCQSMLKMSKVK